MVSRTKDASHNAANVRCDLEDVTDRAGINELVLREET